MTASLYRALLAVPVAGATVAIGVDDLLGARQLEVEKPVENIRSSPNGEQIGTLVKGVEVEELEQEGKWVRINVEGWIWGPSLRGFEPGEEAVERPRETGRKEERSALASPRSGGQRARHCIAIRPKPPGSSIRSSETSTASASTTTSGGSLSVSR